MTPPVRVGVVIPADTIYSVFQVDAAVRMVEDACAIFRDAAIRETGYALDFLVEPWRSARILLELQLNDDGTRQHDTTCQMPEGYREGFAQNTVLRDVKAGLGWVDYEDATMGGRNGRWVVVVLQGGGVAGGTFQVDNWDGVLPWPAWSFGLVTLGDWGIYAKIFGYGSHCCITKYGTGFCEPVDPLDDLMHEIGHSFGMDTHEEGWYLRGTSPWSPKQKADFLARNAQFIYPAVEEPPAPPTVTGIEVTPTLSVKVGQSIIVNTSLLYSDGAKVTVDALLRVRDMRIATVDNASNTLRGQRQGTTELLVTYEGFQQHVPIVVRKRWW